MGYVLITGGQMQNKGAQAMTFTVVNEMKKLYPQSSVVLLSSFIDAFSEEDAKQYNIINVPFIFRLRLAMSGGIFGFINRVYKYQNYRIRYKDMEEELRDYFINADCLIDISGFALSSQMGFAKSFQYLMGIASAKKYNVPMYIFPQSFGPFEYRKKYMGKIINFLMKKYLKYPEVIYAREDEGLQLIKGYSNKVKRSHDLVLQSRDEIDMENIFYLGRIPTRQLPSIMDNSMAIIPNEKTFVHGNREEILQIYNTIIRDAIASGMYVYLLAHSKEDGEICKKLKEEFLNEAKIILISDEYNCVELQKLIGKFEFVVASRYHSIVHAYREVVPVIALGWAEKYKELLGFFEQDKYVYDVRQGIHHEKIIGAIYDMKKNLEKNRDIIQEKLSLIQKNNIFDEVKRYQAKLCDTSRGE